MVIIEAEVQIYATAQKVWEIISDMDNEPKFWKGTKEIKNISKKGNKINREIIIAFKNKKCMQEIVLFPKERIEITFTKGIIEGKKLFNITLKDDSINLQVIWNIRFSGMMMMFTGIIKRHIKNGTKQALQNIKEEAER